MISDRALLNRSLIRLGMAGSRNMPEVFIEFELALAVRRFGIWKIFIRTIRMLLLRKTGGENL